MIRTRLISILRVVERLERTDIWILVLAVVATLAIAVQLRLKSVERWYEQTSGSSSPLEFHRQLLSDADKTGQWAFLVLDSATEERCAEELTSSTKTAGMATVVVSPTPAGGTVWCAGGDRGIAGPQRRVDLKNVRVAMQAAGARSVLVDLSGRVIYSSKHRILPGTIASLFPALTDSSEERPR